MVDFNNVNTSGLEKAIAEARADRSKAKRLQKVSGQWLFQPGGPQFRAEISHEGGKTVLEADGPSGMGGQGTRPGPLHYCLYGILSCYTSIFVVTASSMGIKLKKVTSQAEGDLNFSQVYGLSREPIIEEVRIFLQAEGDAPKEEIEEAERQARDRCPAVYGLTERIKLQTKLDYSRI
ncbi:MAG: OsmC family protein [Chloroflexi bacterium]|nr:OsmC family protein [Chloroflexota bacterium]